MLLLTSLFAERASRCYGTLGYAAGGLAACTLRRAPNSGDLKFAPITSTACWSCVTLLFLECTYLHRCRFSPDREPNCDAAISTGHYRPWRGSAQPRSPSSGVKLQQMRYGPVRRPCLAFCRRPGRWTDQRQLVCHTVNLSFAFAEEQRAATRCSDNLFGASLGLIGMVKEAVFVCHVSWLTAVPGCALARWQTGTWSRAARVGATPMNLRFSTCSNTAIKIVL